MMLLFLGLLDVIAAALLIIPNELAMCVSLIGIIIFLKGILSILGSAACGYFLDFMGWIDITAGICLCTGVSIPFLWFVLLIKGMFSILSSAGN